MTTMLDELVEDARQGVGARKEQVPLSEIERALESRDRDRPFTEALARPGLSLIAEFKRKSPTVQNIRLDANVSERVRSYERAGAAAVSILTDEKNFGGSLGDLDDARIACDLPILRKDFIVDPYQVYEAAAHGADAILLIVGVLNDSDLSELFLEAGGLDVDCIVEVRTEEELSRALEVGADVIGINNRSFPDGGTVTPDTTFRLMPDVPAGKIVVSESGISSREAVEELERVGVDAVLIGEVLMRAEDPEAKVRELVPEQESTREQPLP